VENRTVSRIAEFARKLHETGAQSFNRTLEPAGCSSRREKLGDVRAVIFDVYGTLINYWRPGFDDAERRAHFLKAALRQVSDRFKFTGLLAEMDPDGEPEKTLYDLYHGGIALCHENAARKGVDFPEAKVEDVWALILLMLKRRGYEPDKVIPGLDGEPAKYLAYAYNFFSLGRELYPGVVDALAGLKKNNIALGIVSNAQFYTPMDLTLLVRDQSRGAYDDFNEMFDPDLTFFSYEYNSAKPGGFLLKQLYNALYERHILPGQTVFVGNDLVLDIDPAAKAGMRTAFFAGDRNSAFFHGMERTIVPDIVFNAWDELPRKISFFKEKGAI
jgi:putative hydrolase of the HAD superfamily